MENVKLKTKTFWEMIHQNRCYFSTANLTSYQEKLNDWDNSVVKFTFTFNTIVILENSP